MSGRNSPADRLLLVRNGCNVSSITEETSGHFLGSTKWTKNFSENRFIVTQTLDYKFACRCFVFGNNDVYGFWIFHIFWHLPAFLRFGQIMQKHLEQTFLTPKCSCKINCIVVICQTTYLSESHMPIFYFVYRRHLPLMEARILQTIFSDGVPLPEVALKDWVRHFLEPKRHQMEIFTDNFHFGKKLLILKVATGFAKSIVNVDEYSDASY